MRQRQIPRERETFLDHVGFFVRNLGAAGDVLEDRGFQLSPINVQTARGEDGQLRPVGTSNRNAILRLGFVELLSPTSASPLSAQMEAAIERYEGAHLIALSQSDLSQTRRRLTANGWQMEELVRLRGGDPEVGWDVLRCEPRQMPEGRIQFAICTTPERVWTPSSSLQPNGIEGLASVLLVVDGPAEAAARFGRYIGQLPQLAGDFAALDLDRGRLCFVAPDRARSAGLTPTVIPQIVAVGLSTERPAQVESWARSNQVQVERVLGGLRIDLGPPLNAVLAVHEPSVDPWRNLVPPDQEPRGPTCWP